VPTFARQNQIPELAGVAEEFDDMVDTLQHSARSIKLAAEDNAHALKTPIAIIRQCLEPLSAKAGDSEGRGNRAVEMIGSALDRLDTLVSFARRMDETEAELIAPPQDIVNPGRVLRHLVMEYEELVRKKSVTVETDADDEISIRASDDLIETVFENLLENALSFSPPSGTIRMSVRRSGPNAELTVEDEGIGVASENLQKIFTRYYSDRPDASQGPSGNHMGIGLWTVRRKIEAIGGVVTAENRDDGGLRVVALVPALA
jgi:two-component system sensor histidine kinase ChvG